MLELGIKEYFDVETARSANEAEIMMATRSYGVVGCDHLMPGEEGLAGCLMKPLNGADLIEANRLAMPR